MTALRKRLSDWWFYQIYSRWDLLVVRWNEWMNER